jgi:hypothetical protein
MPKPKIKLAILDHNYHFKTRSSDFIRNILKKEFLIKDFWIDKKLKLKDNFFLYENYYFHQILPPLKVLEKLKNKNLMWAPMYDSPHYPMGFSPLLWKIINYYNIKVLSFSKKLSDLMSESNVNFINLSYYKKSIIKKVKNKNKVNIFFWFRNDLQIKDWINLFKPSTVNKIDLFSHKDQIKPNIPNNIKNKYKINLITSNFTKKNTFLKILNKNDIFVAPRKIEGIGMSLVEALAQGKYVVGYNESTMNEYIINKKIGLLIPSKKKFQISFLNRYSNYRLKINDTFYQKWKNDKFKILSFFNSKKAKNRYNKVDLIYIYISYYLKLIIRKFFLLIN